MRQHSSVGRTAFSFFLLTFMLCTLSACQHQRSGDAIDWSTLHPLHYTYTVDILDHVNIPGPSSDTLSKATLDFTLARSGSPRHDGSATLMLTIDYLRLSTQSRGQEQILIESPDANLPDHPAALLVGRPIIFRATPQGEISDIQIVDPTLSAAAQDAVEQLARDGLFPGLYPALAHLLLQPESTLRDLLWITIPRLPHHANAAPAWPLTLTRDTFIGHETVNLTCHLDLATSAISSASPSTAPITRNLRLEGTATLPPADTDSRRRLNSPSSLMGSLQLSPSCLVTWASLDQTYDVEFSSGLTVSRMFKIHSSLILTPP